MTPTPSSPTPFSLSAELLSQLSSKIAVDLGMYFPEPKWNDLKRGLQTAIKEFGHRNEEELANFLLSPDLTKDQIETLASCLTIGETYFFRDPQVYEALEKNIIPDIIFRKGSSSRSLRIWSAACSTGEEPYSLAIILGRIPALKGWNIFLLATDINPISLKKAQAGFFSNWSFRGISEETKKRYFRQVENGAFEILPEIRDSVSFANLNFAENSYPSPITRTTSFDIIFCRNVLMYFHESLQKKVVSQLYQCLLEDGRLIVSATETSTTLFNKFKTVNYPFGVVYQKTSLHQPREFSIPLPTGFILPGSSEAETEPTVEARSTSPLREFTTSVSGTPTTEDEGSQPRPRMRQAMTREEPQKPGSVVDSQAILATCADLYNKGLFGETAVLIESFLVHQTGSPIEAGVIHRLATMLIHSLANQNKSSEALEFCERYLARDKMNQQWYLLKATLLQELCRIPQAIETLKQVLYLDHKNSMALYYLAGLYRKQNQKKESEKHFEQARQALLPLPPEAIIDPGEHLTAGRLLQMVEVSLARLKKA